MVERALPSVQCMFYMDSMRFSHIRRADLNLLLALEALYEERNITRAAAKVALSQPAMSRVLARLRDMFKDELFVRGARGLVPTRRAERVHVELERMLPVLEALLRDETFEPATATDRFAIAATDYDSIVVLRPALADIYRQAPHVQIVVRPWSESSMVELIDSGRLDLGLCAGTGATPLESEVLFRERFVCILRKGHPAARGRLAMKTYLACSHIAVDVSGGGQPLIDEQLERSDAKRRVALLVPSFATAIFTASVTDFIVTAPERLAVTLARSAPVQVVDAPTQFRSFDHVQVWHRRNAEHAAHRWLRNAVKAAARHIG